MLRRGFSLIEVIMVVSLVGAIAGVGIPLYRDYQIRNDLNLATEQVTQGLARARLLSQAAQNDDNWGFYAPAGVLYKGDTYDTRDPAFDETYPMPSTITIQGLMEVNYGKIGGVPDATGEITLTTINDDTRNVLIEVKTESIAVVTEDRFTICHHPGTGQNTLSIPDNAWPAHQSHGDAFGACVTTSSAAAASSAAPASSSRSSVAVVASSAAAVSSSTTPASCPDRVAVDTDGTIRILGSLSVTFVSYGAQFGYGNGGPTVPVTVSYRKKNSGNWTDLFSGNAINGTGGASQTVTGFNTSNNNNRLYVRFHAYYSQRGWLTYDNYAYSNTIPTVYMLRDGDTPPAINPGNGQAAVSSLLRPITDSLGKIDVGQFDVVLLADFNRASCSSCNNYYCTNCTGVDYQDGVVLVRFNNPAC
jgi:prepilin-type N-terminal cleavage/methylation domain-containing protein